MRASLLELLRCPFCGGRLAPVAHDGLPGHGSDVGAGVLGCECCAFPIVDGIPVLLADDATREAMHALEAGEGEAALFGLLGLDEARAPEFRRLLARGPDATFRDAIAALSPDPEGTYFLYRFSDPTFVTADALLRALGQVRGLAEGPALDLCGGSGHLTRTLVAIQAQARRGAASVEGPDVVLADLHFWKLWLARRFVSPDCMAVCCDANQPLPFRQDAFRLAVVSDAFPYIWQKRLLAGELVRLAGPEGAVVLPHLHSSLGENVSAGMTLTPAAYRDLFDRLQPRLFREAALFAQIVDQGRVDLRSGCSPEELGDEPSLALVASRRGDLFRDYEVPDVLDVRGVLRVNPLYRIERRDGESILALDFPTPEYEQEFGACRRYLPQELRLKGDLTGPIDPSAIGPDYAALRRRRVLLDLPPGYL